ncbi:hypothetical protein BOSE62_30226 [Bosea sp. 62]|nr:hypothetical protein BOSE21B_111400 [Bosea sp. 21B]VVT62346.1 hypothetical protein BOS5A_80006 [Bosea sp. EC-HK365B]VXB89044.1 hypothetical protein BOSE29B_140007 [Bosea sp. 29B]VXC14631.1 hypothetical protein BOSE62_30226 [Bosea sp. 62]VXC27637.1 hypothetical protein BOSE125_190007 [Bosea sp. 125]VXC66721.1 hypothetical protein BOSE127_30255 [Bosea sp. 127]
MSSPAGGYGVVPNGMADVCGFLPYRFWIGIFEITRRYLAIRGGCLTQTEKDQLDCNRFSHVNESMAVAPCAKKT